MNAVRIQIWAWALVLLAAWWLLMRPRGRWTLFLPRAEERDEEMRRRFNRWWRQAMEHTTWWLFFELVTEEDTEDGADG